jgi:hypothetical protein
MDESTRQGVLFREDFAKGVSAVFDADASSSDGGAILLGAVDRRSGVTRTLAASLADERQQGKVRHAVEDLVRQRVFGIGLGLADCNDAERSAGDPVMKLVCGRSPIRGEDLASQPTLSRFENAPSAKELVAMQRGFEQSRLDVLCRRHRGVRRVVIDVDATDDPTHGSQQGALFNGFYGTWCYLPLVAFVAFAGDPEQYAVSARLRPGSAKSHRGAVPMVRRIVRGLRRRMGRVRILVRLDAGFASPTIFNALDALGVDYVVGTPSNPVLDRAAEPHMAKSRARVIATAASAQTYGDFGWTARGWPRERRVVKAEILVEPGKSPRDNERFVVTNLQLAPEDVYTVYRQRGDSENRLKELLLDLEMDRTSCSRFLANQLRVLFTLAAYALYQDLRWHLRGQERLTVASLRLRLVKIGTRITESVRRVVLHLPVAHPWKDLFRRAALAVGAVPG